MWLVLKLLAAGVFPAVWLSGYVLLGRYTARQRLPLPPITVCCLAPALSLPIWTLLMVVTAHAGVFSATAWGALGWIISAALLPLAWRHGRLGHRQGRWKALSLSVTLLSSFLLYATFPHDSFFVGRDQAVYANQALHIARSGKLVLDDPIPSTPPELIGLLSRGYTATGVYTTSGPLTVQFSPAFPTWLSVAFSATGIRGLQWFNSIVGTLSGAVFFGLAAQLVSRRIALAATLLFSFNPIQIWISRITLSEVLTQYLLLSGLLLGFLAGRPRRHRLWPWAGVTLGATVLVRIDAFVLTPLLGAFAWLLRTVPHHRGPSLARAQRLAVLAALIVLAAGVPFYWLTSEPYFRAQRDELLALSGCTVLLLLVAWVRLGRRPLAYLVNRRTSWIALGAALAILCVFALYVRPRWTPFALYDSPGFPLHGARDFREDSLRNLAVYVTPVIVFAAFAGFWDLLRRACTRPGSGAAFLLLLVLGGYSVLYLYKPSISSDHPWGMRRFVPAVIPGAILLSALAFEILYKRIHIRRVSVALMGLTTAALVIYPNYRARAALFLQEYEGAYRFVSEVADAVPHGAMLVCDVTPRLFGHLVLGKGLRTFQLNFRDPKLFEAGQSVLAAHLRDDEPYYLLTQDPNYLGSEEPLQTFVATFRWLAESHTAPATTIQEATFHFRLFELRGRLGEPWKYLANLGVAPVGGVTESGFWSTEIRGAEQSRWTKAESSLEIPITRGVPPRTLEMEIIGMPPKGTRLTVRANGSEIHDATITTAPTTLSLNLPSELGERLKLEFATPTFRPSDVAGSKDTRELGIRLRSLALR